VTEHPSVILSLSGERCRVTCANNPAAIRALAHDVAPFVVGGEPTLDVSIEFDHTLMDPPAPGWKKFRMVRSEDGYVVSGPSHWIRISPGLDRVDARVIRYFQVATVLRIALCTILPIRGQGFLTHAAAIAGNSGGYLFPGRSGAGKSTIVENSPGKRCLAEENAVVRKENGEYQVFGFPLWARLYALSMIPEPTPLKGMFLLAKGSPQINPVTSRHALTYLMRSVCFPLEDVESRNRVLDTCSKFVREVPVAELVFAKNPEFWRCIERD